MFKGQVAPEEKTETISLPVMSESEQVVKDYASTSLSVKAHPGSFIREKLSQLYVLPNKELASKKNGEIVKVAGVVLVRQRPGTAKGVCFMTIEDETGWANAVIFSNLFDKHVKRFCNQHLSYWKGNYRLKVN